VKSRAAAEKLSRGEATNQVSSSDFDHVLTDATPMLLTATSSIVGGGTKSFEMVASTDARTKAYKGLEQLVLKNLVESMLPKESDAFFGDGTGSGIWRSFLADQLATQIGKTVDLGIAHQPPALPNSAGSRASVHSQVQLLTHSSPLPYGSS
jgi:peptidoglycan hydrolase FlgJ